MVCESAGHHSAHIYMTLLKRFELWLLLILIGGGLYYVLNLSPSEQTTGQRPAIANATEEINTNKPPVRFVLQKTIISRDDDHFLIEIEVLCHNPNAEALLLPPDTTQLFAANGQPAATFFLPFQAPRAVPANSEKSITLRYWLNHDSFKGPISLKIDGEHIKIKNSRFDSDSLADTESLTFTTADWTPKP